MCEEDTEKFEITDYDLANEFNINRPRTKLTKHQQIYGVWADESSGDDEEAGSKRPSFKSSKKPKNYTAPIGFVAGGTQQAGKKEEKTEAQEDSEEDVRTKAGFKISSSESEDDEKPASFRQKIFDTSGDIAGLRRHRKVDTTLIKSGVGGWEMHTKGIGAKLLLQMGYEPGKGLGKALQGINAPIVAKLRRGRGAIGAYGPEEAAKIAEIKTMDSKTKEKVTSKLSRWRKDDDTVNKKVRYVYKTIEEVIEQGQGSAPSVPVDSTLSKVKVIDMTGPEQRVLSGYHAISRQQRPAAEWETRKDLKFTNFALPELQHNLNLLVDLCEQDIINSDRKYKTSSDRIVSLQYETSNLQRLCIVEEEEISRLESLLQIVDDLTAAHEANQLTLERACSDFNSLQERYGAEYRAYDLPELATTFASSLVKDALQPWQPLENPNEPFSLLKPWRQLLENEQASLLSTLANPEPWGKLLWHSWVPSIRYCVTHWNSRQPEPMLRLIETWKMIVPPWILHYILESLILPRITFHVHEWDPMSDTVPIHSWIHPWLPYLHLQLQTVVFPMIRQELSQALTAWHPSDRSARLMLLPWCGVFTSGEMNAFLIRNILPKLQQTMSEFVINPQHQILDQHWKWVMDWVELMPPPSMASLLTKNFFPKWLQVLSVWLNHCPNFDQVSAWYMGWKALFPESLLKQTEIKEQFRQALELMNRSVGASAAPGAIESVSYLKNIDREAASAAAAQSASARFQSMSEAVRMGSQVAVSGFRALFAKRCEEKDIVFVPIPNKTHEGKQVYRCGSVQVYLDRNVIFLSQNGGASWQPQSMATVLNMAEK